MAEGKKSFKSYKEKLLEPEWLEKRQEVLERDNFQCTICDCKEDLEVHHLYYIPNTDPWDYDIEALKTVCKMHHEILTFELGKLAGLIAFQILNKQYGIYKI